MSRGRAVPPVSGGGRADRRHGPAARGDHPGRRRLVRALAPALLAVLTGLLLTATASDAQQPTVLATRVASSITPVAEDHLAEGLRRAEQEDHAALLVEIDTPGGGLEPTRAIVQDFLAATVPVVVYVAPSGARAASAGAYITMAAHIAAMAPGTHIGAGTPVTGQGGPASDKIVNDSAAFAVSIAERRGRSIAFAEDMVRDGTSVTAREALRGDVVDLAAPSRDAVLAKADGRRVTVGEGDRSRPVVLHTAGARVVQHDLGFLGRLRELLANPELAYLFLSVGTLAVIYEIAAPGMGFGGILGVVLLILGFVALSVLPFNAAGLLLVGLAAALFAAEVLSPGVGVFAAGGTVSLVLAGIFLFRGEQGVDPAVMWPTALVVGAGSLVAGRFAWRARGAPVAAGGETLIGREAVVHSAGEDSGGRVPLDGAWWTVRGRGAPVTPGQRVRVVDRDGLVLVVEGTGPDKGRPPPPTEKEPPS